MKHILNLYMFHTVIQGIKGKLAQQVYNSRPKKGFPSQIFDRASLLFTALEAAVELADLRFPPGNRLEEMKGDRSGQYSIRVNDQWRIRFIWTPQGPADVEIVDYH